MASAGTFTVTGKTGTGLTMSAQVFTGIREFRVDIANAMLKMIDASGAVIDVSIGGATTFTVTLSAAAGNYTVTVS